MIFFYEDSEQPIAFLISFSSLHQEFIYYFFESLKNLRESDVQTYKHVLFLSLFHSLEPQHFSYQLFRNYFFVYLFRSSLNAIFFYQKIDKIFR